MQAIPCASMKNPRVVRESPGCFSGDAVHEGRQNFQRCGSESVCDSGESNRVAASNLGIRRVIISAEFAYVTDSIADLSPVNTIVSQSPFTTLRILHSDRASWRSCCLVFLNVLSAPASVFCHSNEAPHTITARLRCRRL